MLTVTQGRASRRRTSVYVGFLSAVVTGAWLAGAIDGPRMAAAQQPLAEIYLPVVGQHWTTGVDAPETRIEVAAQYGGPSWAVAVDGDTAYLGLGATVAVVDVSDLDSPQVVATSEVLPGVVKGLAAHHGYVYAAVDDRHQITGQGGLHAIDVRQPTRPRLAGRLFMDLGAEGVALDGTYAYVVTGRDLDKETCGLRIVDVSRPSRLVQVGQLSLESVGAPPVLSGDRLYVGADVVDVSDRNHPRLVASLTEPHGGSVVGADDDGAHVYVLGASPQRLFILDLADPDHAVEVGTVTLDDTTDLLWGAVGDGFAYVTGHHTGDSDIPGGGRLQIVDFSDPAAPRLAGSLDTTGAGFGVAVRGSMALMTHNHGDIEFEGVSALSGGMLVVDASDAEQPAVRGSIERPGGFISAVDAAGRIAWFAEGRTNWYEPGNVYGRLWSLGSDTEGDPDPRILGSIGLPTKPLDLAIDTSLGVAFTAHQRDAVLAVDVNDPTTPALVGSTGVVARTVAARDHLLVATEPERDTFVTIDTTDPAAPTVLGRLPYEMGPEWVPIDLEPAHAWLARGYIDVVDVGDPSKPAITAVLPLQDRWVFAVDADDEYAYVAAAGLEDTGGAQWLMVIDAQQLIWPRVLGEVLLPKEDWSYGGVQSHGVVKDVSVTGDWAWVAMSSGAVILVDVADPAAPRVIDLIDQPDYIQSTLPDTVWQRGAIGIQAAVDLAYVAYDPGGLVVLRAVER